MDKPFREISACRVCSNTNLEPILSLGEQYVIDFLSSPDAKALKTPLDILICDPSNGGCGLLQLKHTVTADLMYRQYWYKSGINESMIEALRDIVTKGEKVAKLKAGDIAIDIGCNDGTLLKQFTTKGVQLVGYEPARNLVDEAKTSGATIINDYFNAPAFKKMFGDKKAKLITSIAMFYDLGDPNAFVHDIVQCLADDGVWIIQMAYLPSKIELNAFDETSQEHLEYYSLYTLEYLLGRHNLEVFDLETNKVNGGSIRTYIRKKGSSLKGFEGAEKRLQHYRTEEKELGLDNKKVYEEFASRVEDLKNKTYNFIKQEVEKGKKVYVYGASTKGNTLLQYYGLNNKLITAAAERNPAKYGRIIVGSGIPIVPEADARKDADYFLVLPWHFMDVFIKREADFLKNGGKFIVPLPEFKVVGAEAIPSK